jgi:hypothetical protein
MEKTNGSETMHHLSIAAFSDDGRLSVDELDGIVDAGLENGVMGEAEKQVLAKVITRLTSTDMTPELWKRIETLIDRFELDQIS